MDLHDPIFLELTHQETSKQIIALSKLLQLVSNGRDATVHVNTILEICLNVESRAVKLLSYSILRGTNLTAYTWETQLLPHIMVDYLHPGDVELCIASWKLLAQVPFSLIDIFLSEKINVQQALSHANPFVRSIVIDTLGTFLVHRNDPSLTNTSSRQFVTSSWDFITNTLLNDTSPLVYQRCFPLIASLFSLHDTLKTGNTLNENAKSTTISNSKHIDPSLMTTNGFDNTFFMAFSMGERVYNSLVPHFENLLHKIRYIDPLLRHHTISAMVYIATYMLNNSFTSLVSPTFKAQNNNNNNGNDNNNNSNNNSNTNTAQNHSFNLSYVFKLVEGFLIPSLSSMDDSTVFQSGKGILKIVHCVTNSVSTSLGVFRTEWVVSVVTSFLSLIKRESAGSYTHNIVDLITNTLTLTPPHTFITYLLRIIASVKDFYRLEHRLHSLYHIFELVSQTQLSLIEPPATRKGFTKHFSQNENFYQSIIDNTWIKSLIIGKEERINRKFREELFICLVRSFTKTLSPLIENSLMKNGDLHVLHGLNVAFSIVVGFIYCLEWESGANDESVAETYLKLLDWLCRMAILVKPLIGGAELYENLLNLLKDDLFERFSRISSDSACLQAIFLCCKYCPEIASKKYPEKEEPHVFFLLKKRFLLFDEASTHKRNLLRAQRLGSLIQSTSERTNNNFSNMFDPPSPKYAQAVFEVLKLVSVVDPLQISFILPCLQDLSSNHTNNSILQSRIIAVQRQIQFNSSKASQSLFTNLLRDFGFFLPTDIIEQPHNTLELPQDRFFVEYKKATIFSFSPTTLIFPPQILCSSSDAVTIDAWHLVRRNSWAAKYSVFLNVRVTNRTGQPLENIQISLGLFGKIELDLSSVSNGLASPRADVQTIKRLDPDEPFLLTFPLTLSAFDLIRITVFATFQTNHDSASLFIGDSSVDGVENTGKLGNFGDNDRDDEPNQSEIAAYVDYGALPSVVSLPTVPYNIDAIDFLVPVPYTFDEYIQQYDRFSSKFVSDFAFHKDLTLEKVVQIFDLLPFSKVTMRTVGEGALQTLSVSYASMTWWEDQLLLNIDGAKDLKTQSLGIRLEFRSTHPQTLSVVQSCLSDWVQLCVLTVFSTQNIRYQKASPFYIFSHKLAPPPQFENIFCQTFPPPIQITSSQSKTKDLTLINKQNNNNNNNNNNPSPISTPPTSSPSTSITPNINAMPSIEDLMSTTTTTTTTATTTIENVPSPSLSNSTTNLPNPQQLPSVPSFDLLDFL